MGRNNKLKENNLEKGIYKRELHSSYKKYIAIFLAVIVCVVVIVSGCAPQKSSKKSSSTPDIPVPSAPSSSEVTADANAEAGLNDRKDLIANNKINQDTRMVSFDIKNIGRSNPFMPYNEYLAYERARIDAYNEANEHNARISKIKSLQGQKIREEDDISPYSFNLPVPPTSLAGEESTAVKITKTKVVGIMYNSQSPSAIINIDNKDYLVRPGDKIIDERYIVDKINKSYITVSMGANIYSAAIGELFTEDRLETNQTDLYNIKHRFGGRRG